MNVSQTLPVGMFSSNIMIFTQSTLLCQIQNLSFYQEPSPSYQLQLKSHITQCDTETNVRRQTWHHTMCAHRHRIPYCDTVGLIYVALVSLANGVFGRVFDVSIFLLQPWCFDQASISFNQLQHRVSSSTSCYLRSSLFLLPIIKYPFNCSIDALSQLTSSSVMLCVFLYH